MTGYNYLIAYTNKLCYGHAVSAPVSFNDYVVDLRNGHAVSAPVSLLERTAIDTCDHSMWAEVFPLTPRQGKALAPEVPEGAGLSYALINYVRHADSDVLPKTSARNSADALSDRLREQGIDHTIWDLEACLLVTATDSIGNKP